jgi:predicted peptidase
MATYEYYVHYPEDYLAGGAHRWPVLIALHGAGERAVPLEVLQTHHYFRPMFALTARDYPAVVVIPRCPPRHYWEPDLVDNLRETLIATIDVDPERVYLTGFSMGGYGTWLTAGFFPDYYAAIAPICGGGDPDHAARLAPIPTWAFHGARDETVPVEETMAMIEAIEKAGGAPRVTIYPEGTHGVWDETWANPALYEWFLTHWLGERRKAA